MSVGLLEVDAVVRSQTASRSYSSGRQLILTLLVILWLVPGLTNRDPWKPVETVTIPAVAESIEQGSILVPRLFGQPVIDLPPFVVAVAVAGVNIFGGYFEQYEAMRIANVIWLVLGLLLIGLAVGIEQGSRVGWRTVLLVTGSPALLLHSKTLNQDLALLLVSVAGFVGILKLAKRPLFGYSLLGFTALIGVWIAGLISLWYLVALLIGYQIMQKQIFSWRDQTGTIAVVLLGLVSLVTWLQLLVDVNPELPKTLGNEQLARLAPLSLIIAIQDLIADALWVLWPSLPFCAIAVMSVRKLKTSQPEIQLGLLGIVACSFAIIVAGRNQESSVFMLLPITAWIASISVTSVTKEIAKAMDWFAIIVIGGGLIGFFWITWILAQAGVGENFLAWLEASGIDRPKLSFNVVLAVLASLLWIGLMLRIGRSPERSVLNWMAGTTMGWWVFVLLWMPYVDQARSYKYVAQEFDQYLVDIDCVKVVGIEQTVAAQLEYFTQFKLFQDKKNCPFTLTYASSNEAGEIIWEGRRAQDNRAQGFVLLRKT